MFDWEDFRHFAALARAGTLAGAARELKVDHATVGRRVASLEAALGLALVTRLARSYVLTPAGARIATFAAGFEEAAEAVARTVRAGASGTDARVVLSAPPAFATAVLAPALAKLHDLRPGLRVVLIGEARSASLARQEADVAIRLSRPTDTGYVARRAGTMRFAFHAAPGYCDRPERSWEFIGHDRTQGGLPQDELLRRVAGARPVILETNDLASQRSAAAAGIGIATLPDFLASGPPRLEEVPIPGGELLREMWIVIHADMRRSPPVRIVMDFLADLLGALPAGSG